MKTFRIVILAAALACACADEDTTGEPIPTDAAGDATSPDADEATDGTDGTDGSESTDSTDASDGTDGSEGTDGAEGTDSTDATDGTDATDLTDDTDSTEIPGILCADDLECQELPAGPCEVASCDLSTGECITTARDDGEVCSTDNPCVTDETCQAGECVGTEVVCADEDPCTEDACHPEAGCQYAVVPGCCEPNCDGKECGPDGCNGLCGVCADDGLCSPEGTCCVPDCEGLECGSDGCGGSCGKCDIGLACGDDGLCACKPSCNGKDCGPDGCGGICGECTDGDVCSPKGQCLEPACTPDCEGLECGDDGCGGTCGECEATGQCQASSCVEGQCVDEGVSGGTCSDDLICTTGDTCEAGVCAGTAALDTYEPNDSPTGHYLGTISDCDNEGGVVTADLSPFGDVDWFWFKVNDTIGCDVEPQVDLKAPLNVDADLCVFFTCTNGNTVSLSCPSGTTQADDVLNKARGCCRTVAANTEANIKLGGISCGVISSETGWVDVRVRPSQPEAGSCHTYTLKYADK